MLTQTKTIQSRYNLPHCLNLLEVKGKEAFGDHFKIAPEDHEIIYSLILYFLKDEDACKELNISTNKGIILSGPIGCGKTSLMTVLRAILPMDQRFNIKSCRQVSFEFNKDGYDIIHKYSTAAYSEFRPITYCFDDLGTESSIKFFGNDCNVMTEILLSRYDQFVSRKMITHITTNLNGEEIGQQYGPRVRSRMREQFNLISFDRSTRDKRN